MLLMTTKLCTFFTGAYEGRLVKVDPTGRASARRVLILVNMGSGVTKKVAVSVGNIARPHPDKPQNFAQAVAMQKPNFKKAFKALAKKYVVMGGYKKDKCMNGLLDLLSVECEIANENLKHVDEIQHYD
eukprot:15132351-Ditylum_brightwellii.AAC.1